MTGPNNTLKTWMIPPKELSPMVEKSHAQYLGTEPETMVDNCGCRGWKHPILVDHTMGIRLILEEWH
jgi:hypothetical protein